MYPYGDMDTSYEDMINSINEKLYLNNKDFEILCSWNGDSQDLNKIHNLKNYNLKVIKIKPYNFLKNDLDSYYLFF